MELITLGLLADKAVSQNVDRVRSGEEALAYRRRSGGYWNRLRPDLGLTDLKPPRADGYDVLMAVKPDAEFRSIPVVALSKSQGSADSASVCTCDANSYPSEAFHIVPGVKQDAQGSIYSGCTCTIGGEEVWFDRAAGSMSR